MPEGKNEPKAAPADAAASSAPLISKKGWIVVIAIVIMEAVFFSVVVFMKGSDKVAEDKGVEGKAAPGEEAKKFASQKHVIIDNLTYSVAITPSTNANLMIGIDLAMGRTQEEIRQKIEPNPEEEKQFHDAVKALIPNIKNQLISIISDQTFATLTKGQGREDILSRVKTYVNDELERMEFELKTKGLSKRRVTDVIYTSYLIQ